MESIQKRVNRLIDAAEPQDVARDRKAISAAAEALKAKYPKMHPRTADLEALLDVIGNREQAEDFIGQNARTDAALMIAMIRDLVDMQRRTDTINRTLLHQVESNSPDARRVGGTLAIIAETKGKIEMGQATDGMALEMLNRLLSLWDLDSVDLEQGRRLRLAREKDSAGATPPAEPCQDLLLQWVGASWGPEAMECAKRTFVLIEDVGEKVEVPNREMILAVNLSDAVEHTKEKLFDMFSKGGIAPDDELLGMVLRWLPWLASYVLPGDPLDWPAWTRTAVEAAVFLALEMGVAHELDQPNYDEFLLSLRAGALVKMVERGSVG